jgi:asparagine synthase (glutamine-hydrolysing)
VQKIFPGEVVRIRGDEVSRDVFWHPETIERWQLSVEAAAERYLDLLDSAVACRLRRQSGRVGVHLSSGYDTNAVASSVALQCPSGEVRAYTAAPSPQFKGYVPRGRNADESPLASLTARKYGLHHRIVRSPGMSLDFLRRQARFYQEPFVNVMNALWSDEILCAARDDGATVLLNGALGNATLNAGGLRYLPEWIRQRGIFAWWKQARIAAKRSDVRLRGVAYNSLVPWLPFGSLIAQKIAGTRPSTDYSFFRPEFARQSTHTEHPGASIASGSTAEFRLFSIRQYDPGQLYKGGLGLSGIWELDPLSDRRIVEFSLGYPADRLILDGEYRPIAMKALRERVPAAVLKSDKPRGLQAADWQLHFTSREANDILDEIESRDVAKSLLDTAAMRLAIRQWPKGDITDEAIVDRYAWRLAIALSMGVFMTEVEDQWRERPALRRSTPALTC